MCYDVLLHFTADHTLCMQVTDTYLGAASINILYLRGKERYCFFCSIGTEKYQNPAVYTGSLPDPAGACGRK